MGNGSVLGAFAQVYDLGSMARFAEWVGVVLGGLVGMQLHLSCIGGAEVMRVGGPI